jgi:HNH endonuclease
MKKPNTPRITRTKAKKRKPRNTRTKRAQDQTDEWVPVPTFTNDEGDKVFLLLDAQGQWKVVKAAEMTAMAFIGPCPHGHVLRFKDGDRLNGVPDNLEWVPSEPTVSSESERS